MSRKFKFADGATPLNDLSGLKDKTIQTVGPLYEAEARNIAAATLKYLSARPSRKTAPFSELWMRKLHREMFCNVWDWAGKLRTVEIAPVGVSPLHIAVKLLELEQDLAYWREAGDMPLLEQAARLHHRAVWIHPFLNGNGRWARMLANVLLRQEAGWLVEWPEKSIARESTIRTEYLASLRKADGGNFESLIAIHETYKSEGLD